MFRITRPLAQAVRQSTGLTGLATHSDPLPELTKIYKSTLSVLGTIPAHSVYRQGVEALTRHRLNIVQKAETIAEVEEQLGDGVIELSLDTARDELGLAEKMLEWKAWEPLEEKPEPGQWDYVGESEGK